MREFAIQHTDKTHTALLFDSSFELGVSRYQDSPVNFWNNIK